VDEEGLVRVCRRYTHKILKKKKKKRRENRKSFWVSKQNTNIYKRESCTNFNQSNHPVTNILAYI